MTTIRKPIKKRRRSSPSLTSTSQFGQRLRKLRYEQRNLWDDDDDEDDHDHDEDDDDEDERYVQSRCRTDNKTYIVLSDSEDEAMSSRKNVKNNKSKRKSPKHFHETYQMNNEYKPLSKCATCLICSILTTLTSHNCCSKHLSLLVNSKKSQKQTTNNDQWPPQQVMILPMTDEFIQRYLTSQDIYRLRTRISPTKSPRKLLTKCTMTSDAENTNKTKSKLSKKLTNNESEQPSSSSIVVESTNAISEINNPTDTTYTVITSTSSTVNSFESPTVLDTGQLQQSSDQPLIIDDSQTENQQENSSTNNIEYNKQKDPWIPINDETHTAMEVALNTLDQQSEEQIQFTPATARRTPTELMASLLPRIRLKKGRFQQGKPIASKDSSEATTTNQCQSSKTLQPSPVTTSAFTNSTNTRPLSTLTTIVEDESLVIHSTRSISDKSNQSSHILSERHENTTEGLSDTVMSCLFAQDESSQHDNVHIVTKTTVTNEVLVPPAIVIEDCSNVNDLTKLGDVSQSSLLSNDTQQLLPTTTNEKTTTPSRISYRMNPDGTRVSISRPALATSHQSPLTSIRRTQTDLTTITSHVDK